MMFWTEAKLAALEAEVETWIGTPLMANCAVKGRAGGVSCHRLVYELATATGMIPSSVEAPVGSLKVSPLQRQRLIVGWMDANACPPCARAEWPAQPGDVVALRGGHMAMVLQRGRMVHVLGRDGVSVDELQDATWLARIIAIWRMQA